MNNRVALLFEDLSFHTDYEFLEFGKDDEEIKKIAEKRGLVTPSRDLAFFKGKYAFTDKANLNGCTLPKEEVEKALDTLVGKPVDKDHLRHNTLGYWLDSKLINGTIISYGCFWKSNYPDDFTEIKQRMKEGKLKISFEAWGDRIPKESGYDLTNIEFAGGALLFDTKPAFPGAEVIEFSKYEGKVLEFARVMTDEEKLHFGLDKAQMSMYDFDTMVRMMYEVKTCPHCKVENPLLSPTSIDFEKDYIKAKCASCGSGLKIDLEPTITVEKKGKKIKNISTIKATLEETEMALVKELEGEDALKLTYKERQDIKDDMFAVIADVEGEIAGETQKIRVFPILDKSQVENALARLPKVTEIFKNLGISEEKVQNKILKRARELNMTDIIKRHTKGGIVKVDEILKKYGKATIEEVIAHLEGIITAKDTEMATLKNEKVEISQSLESLKKELDEAKEAAKAIQAKLDEKLAAEKATIIKVRKEELGPDFSKDIPDADILNDIIFENLKLKKENAALKAKVPVTKGGLEAGQTIDNTDPVLLKQKNIHEIAFSETDNEDTE